MAKDSDLLLTNSKTMKTKIQIFKSEQFGEIRTCQVDNQIMFVGKDVAKALGYSNTQKAIRDHVDEDDKQTERFVLSGQTRNMVIINESGLYSLILSSKLEQARAFKRWVTSEVLPQIRMTGGYIPTRNAEGEPLSESEVLHLAENIMQRTISCRNLPADDCVTTSDIAQMMGMKTKELYRRLVELGIVFWNGSRYLLSGQYEHLDYAQERHFHYYALDGEKKQRSYLVWTLAGSKFVQEELMKVEN